MDLTTSPFKRLREACGLSGADFTREAAISRTTTVYCDAGLYIVPRAAEALERLCDERKIEWHTILDEEYGSQDIDIALVIWQRAVRKSHAGVLRDTWKHDSSTVDGDESLSPLDVLARGAFGSRDAFCKAMKVQTGPLSFYLDDERVRPLPVMLKTALLDGGLTPTEVHGLDLAVDQWKEARSGGASAA